MGQLAEFMGLVKRHLVRRHTLISFISLLYIILLHLSAISKTKVAILYNANWITCKQLLLIAWIFLLTWKFTLQNRMVLSKSNLLSSALKIIKKSNLSQKHSSIESKVACNNKYANVSAASQESMNRISKGSRLYLCRKFSNLAILYSKTLSNSKDQATKKIKDAS